MKKMMTLILVLALLLCAGSALATEPKVFRADGTPAVPMEDDVFNDYFFDDESGSIGIFVSGLTIKDWNGTSIYVNMEEPAELTLDNVHLESDVPPPRGISPITARSDLSLILRNQSSMKSVGSAIELLGDNGSAHLAILGDGTLHADMAGILLSSNGSGDSDKASITIGGNVQVSGDMFAFYLNEGFESKNIYIDGKNYPNISAEAGESSTDAAALEGSPFTAKTDVYEQVNAVKFLRTQYTAPVIPQPDDSSALPKTGDNSHMALWFAMMSLAGVALFTLKRKTV